MKLTFTGPVVSEEKMFKECGRRTGDRRCRNRFGLPSSVLFYEYGFPIRKLFEKTKPSVLSGMRS